MDDPRLWPVHVLGQRPRSAFTQILVPALAFRVLLETSDTTPDVLLEAVSGLRSAGIHDPAEQSRLLGLPQDLVEFLLEQQGDRDGQERTRVTSTVVRTGLGRVLAKDFRTLSPAFVEYSESGWPQTVREGSRGDPVRRAVYAVVAERLSPAPTPLRTSDAVAALRRHYDGALRVSPLGEGRPVLVCAYVSSNLDGDPTILDPATNMVDVDLTRAVRDLAGEDDRLARWLVPRGDRTSRGHSPMRADIDQLRELSRTVEGPRLEEADALRSLVTAIRQLLVSVVSTLASVVPMVRPDRASSSQPFDSPDVELREELRAVAAGIRAHRDPRLERLDPDEVTSTGELALSAARELHPDQGYRERQAIKNLVVDRLISLAEDVIPLEEPA